MRATTAAGQTADFGGQWDTNLGLLVLVQEGEAVTGEYTICRPDIHARWNGGRKRADVRLQRRNGQRGWRVRIVGGRAELQWAVARRRSGCMGTLEGNSPSRSHLCRPVGDELRTDCDWIWLSQCRNERDLRLRFRIDRSLGSIEDNRLTFRYEEPEASGEGWFELSDDGQSFVGEWKEDGVQGWANWEGQRIHAQPGRAWLVVLEANWEADLSETEYSFGNMLRSYFTRMPHVRSATPLLRQCRIAATLVGRTGMAGRAGGGGRGLARRRCRRDGQRVDHQRGETGGVLCKCGHDATGSLLRVPDHGG